MSGQLHLVTPTIKSLPISASSGLDVYLKLENLQIPGSFKIRGVGNLVKKVQLFCFVFNENVKNIKLIYKLKKAVTLEKNVSSKLLLSKCLSLFEVLIFLFYFMSGLSAWL